MREPAIKEIQRAVAERCGVTMDRLLSLERSEPVLDYRMIAMYLARRLTSQSYPAIGRFFGRRDHTTVMSAVWRVASRKDLLRKAQVLELEIMGPIELPGVFPWLKRFHGHEQEL
jgi:chromosomal replication initiation ATPase DnaA